MFSRSNHHDQTAPAHVLAPPAPSPTPQPTSGGWQPSTDLTSAHHLRLESLLDSALAALTLILDTATPIASPTFTDHTTEVLRALCRRILVASPRQGTMTVPTDTTPTPIPTLTPAKIATYAEIVTDTATDRAETPTEAKPIIADQCQSRPTAKFRLKADLIFRLDLEKPGPSTQPHPTALFIALMKSPDVARLHPDGVRWTRNGNLAINFMHDDKYTAAKAMECAPAIWVAIQPLLRFPKRHPCPRVDHGGSWHPVVIHDVPVLPQEGEPGYNDFVGRYDEWLLKGGFTGNVEAASVMGGNDIPLTKKRVPFRVALASRADAEYLVQNGALIFGSRCRVSHYVAKTPKRSSSGAPTCRP
ncbi:hypothetical protein B0H19DRAFT_1195008, partial [Mycena capillaripes]